MPARDTESRTAEGAPVTTGLLWGIKPSFLAYFNRIPGAQSSVTNGARRTSRGRYYFPVSSTSDYDSVRGRGLLRFAGEVTFVGHFGMLRVAIIDPWVTMEGHHSVVSVADPGGQGAQSGRLPLVDLLATGWTDRGGIREWSRMPTALRREAVPIFNDVYPTGEPFDTVDIRVPVGT